MVPSPPDWSLFWSLLPSLKRTTRTNPCTMDDIAPQMFLRPEEVLKQGLELVGLDEKRQARVKRKRNIARFRSHYGSDPLVYAVLLTKPQTSEMPAARIDGHIKKVGARKAIAYFFMAIHLLCCYPTENEAETVFSKCFAAPCVETWSFWAWTFVDNIAALKPEIIFWPEEWSNPDSESNAETIFIITIDGVHCPIEEPNLEDFDENRKFFSHKFHAAGLDYEIAISVFEQKCVWLSGPCGAGKPDLPIFRHKLKQKMLDARAASGVQHRGIADRGHRGERALLSIPSSTDAPAVRDFKGRALSRHENFNGRLKNFDCLDERFRHSIPKHRACMDSCGAIVQLQLENGSPLFVV